VLFKNPREGGPRTGAHRGWTPRLPASPRLVQPDGRCGLARLTLDCLKLDPVRVSDGEITVDVAAVRRNPPGGVRKVWDFTSS